MTRIAAFVIVASLAAISPQPVSASPSDRLAEDVDILLNGAPQKRYAHGPRTWV